VKRLLLSAGISLVIHALVLGFHGEWPGKGPRPSFAPRTITLALTHLHPEPGLTLPVPRSAEPPPSPGEKKSRPPGKDKEVRETRNAVMNEAAGPASLTEQVPVLSAPPAKTAGLHETASLERTSPVPEVKRASVAAPPPLREAHPAYRENPCPGYPQVARRRGMEGTVLLEVWVDSQGGVKDLRVFQSSGHEILDQAAMDAVRRWAFEPARRGDQAVEMWVKVPVRFQLR